MACSRPTHTHTTTLGLEWPPPAWASGPCQHRCSPSQRHPCAEDTHMRKHLSTHTHMRKHPATHTNMQRHLAEKNETRATWPRPPTGPGGLAAIAAGRCLRPAPSYRTGVRDRVCGPEAGPRVRGWAPFWAELKARGARAPKDSYTRCHGTKHVHSKWLQAKAQRLEA